MKSEIFEFDFPVYIITDSEREPLYVEVEILKPLADSLKCLAAFSDEELVEKFIEESKPDQPLTLGYIEINNIEEYKKLLLNSKNTAQYINYNVTLKTEYVRYFGIDDELDRIDWFVRQQRSE